MIFLDQICLNWLRKMRNIDPSRGFHRPPLVTHSCSILLTAVLPPDSTFPQFSSVWRCLLFIWDSFRFKTHPRISIEERVEIWTSCWCRSSFPVRICLSSDHVIILNLSLQTCYMFGLQHSALSRPRAHTHALLFDWTPLSSLTTLISLPLFVNAQC